MGNESSSSNFDGRNIRVEHVRSIWRKVAKGKLLGNGGFSQVYLVTPISRKEIKKVPRLERKKSAYSFPDLISQNQDLAQPDRRQLAMKVIPHRYQHLFYHEVQVMRRLMHENIVNIIKAYKDSKACYILMENLEGRELLEHIIEQKQNSFDEKEAAYYIRQILLALDHLHNNNVVHLDLKPENFMFTSNSGNRILKMIDFGSSLIVQESGEWTQFTGTLQYSAPEVIGSYAKCSGSKLKYSDMWSVGVITFCLVTGKSPFQRSHELEIKEAIYDAKYHYPNNLVDRLSSEVKDFISKLLVVESEKRMTAKDALLHPWITQSSTSAKLYPLDKDVLRGMQNLQVRSKLKREMMKVLMRKLKFEKRDELGRLFLQYDPSGKGILNLREISDVLNKGIGLDRDSAHVLAISIVRELDNSGVGRTQANVLHRLETMESIPLNQDTADQMISCLSEDKKAIISSTDIQEILSSENPSEGNFKNMANKIISDISKGGEQQFSPEEFVNYLNRTIENED